MSRRSNSRTAEPILRLANWVASSAVVAIACVAFAVAPYNREMMQDPFGLTEDALSGQESLFFAAIAYVAMLGVYYFLVGEPAVSKSLRCFRFLVRFLRSPVRTLRVPMPQEDRVALLTTLLKSYFAPLMTMWLMGHCMGAWVRGREIVSSGGADLFSPVFFNQVGFWFLMKAILFVDVLIFTVGYLVESRRLGSEIRSVDPTIMGWAAALLCYPPFNAVTSKVLGSPLSDFPQFDDPTTHLALNLLLLLLMASYASASVALGFKASNLTHRGIVSRGPYAIVRHPAYVCKNLAWWIASIPIITVGFRESAAMGLLNVASVAAWSLLYVLRAVTEEDHLKSVSGEYAAYAARVKYRFIPGLI